MSTDDEKNICLCNIAWKKLTFLLSSFYLGDVVSYDLHVVLITKMCDMTYLILYSTQGDVFMLVEIVFQSSCICIQSVVKNLFTTSQYKICIKISYLNNFELIYFKINYWTLDYWIYGGDSWSLASKRNGNTPPVAHQIVWVCHTSIQIYTRPSWVMERKRRNSASSSGFK